MAAGTPLIVTMQLQDRLSRGLKTVGRNLNRFSSKAVSGFGGAFRGATRFAGALTNINALMRGFIAFKIAQAGFRFFEEIAIGADKINKFSERLGITTEFLSEYAFAANKAGVETQSMLIGFQRFERRLASFVDTGRGPVKDAFDILGSGLSEAAEEGASTEEMITRLAAAFEALDDPQKKVLAAFKLFDTEGVALVQLFQQGETVIAGFRQEAVRAGISLSGIDAARATEMVDAITDLSAALEGLKKTAAFEVIPELTEMLRSFADFIVNNRDDILDLFHGLIEVLASLAAISAKASAGTVSFTKGITMMWDALIAGKDVDPGPFMANILAPSSPFSRNMIRASKLLTNFSNRMKDARKAAREPFPFAIPEQFEVFENIDDDLSDIQVSAKKTGDSIRNAALTGANALSSNLGTALTAIATQTGDADKAFQNFARNFISQIAQMALTSALTGIAGSFFPATTTAKGSTHPTSYQPLRFAKGFTGIVNRRTLFSTPFGAAEVGEIGQAEALVVPLPDNRSIPVKVVGGGRGGGGQTINLSVTIANNVQAIDGQNMEIALRRASNGLARVISERVRQDLGFATILRAT